MPAIARLLLVFWAMWLSIVSATNLLDALRAMGSLPASFRFASGNWGWINQVMDPLDVPRIAQAVMFAGAIGWEIFAAVMFWRAAFTYRGKSLADEPQALRACSVNLALWAAFQWLDEVFLAYQPEAVHRVIFLNQLATLVVLEHLGRRDSRADNRSRL